MRRPPDLDGHHPPTRAPFAARLSHAHSMRSVLDHLTRVSPHSTNKHGGIPGQEWSPKK
jgi:hypothetical protein